MLFLCHVIAQKHLHSLAILWEKRVPWDQKTYPKTSATHLKIKTCKITMYRACKRSTIHTISAQGLEKLSAVRVLGPENYKHITLSTT